MNCASTSLSVLFLLLNILAWVRPAQAEQAPVLRVESERRLEAMIEESEKNRPPLSLQNHNFTKDKFGAPRRDLKNIDLSGSYLEGANFQGMRLRNVKLNHAHLQKANFEDCILEDVKMEGADLSLANFKNAKVGKTSFAQAHMLGTSFEGADLTAANFEDGVLRCANMKHANLTRANLAESDLWCASFDDAKTKDARFEHARRSCPEDPARLCKEHLANKLRD